MNGYLLVDKPPSWTSFDVVNKIRRVSEVKKVGHAGTLDPFATGLLVVLIGNYTKKQSMFMKTDKTYTASAFLGKTSSTGDPEGKIEDYSGLKPSLDEVEAVIKSIIGEQMQTPPAYSAVKIGGKKAYQLARAGKKVSLEPRKIIVYEAEVTDYDYPMIEFSCRVSSGTYIRTLVEDMRH